MRVGINATGLVQRASVAAFVTHTEAAEAHGFSSYWVAEHPTGGLDALTVLAIVGQRITSMELGTAVSAGSDLVLWRHGTRIGTRPASERWADAGGRGRGRGAGEGLPSLADSASHHFGRTAVR